MPKTTAPKKPTEASSPNLPFNFAADVIKVPIDEEMSEAFLAYSMSVISSRAIPDVRDGLKPVQRRILYSMLNMGIRPGTPFKKCARVVGDTMGNYHPHGDSAIYDALVRMGQDFSRGICLIAPQGNFGSLDDPPAAPRYTECRLSEPAMTMLQELSEDTVDFKTTYDGESDEPLYLPSILPNLLVNGVTGIAVGVTTNISPHNLIEVAEAIKIVLKKTNPKPKVEELLKVMLGPDFPSGGTIINDDLKTIYKSGRGSFRLRAKTEIVSLPNQKQAIIVTELPYLIGPEKVIAKMKELMLADRLPEVSDIKNLSDRKVGLRIQIECRSNENPAVLRQKLWKLTPLQDQHYVLNSALVNGVPKQLSLYEMCKEYIDHRIIVIQRRTSYQLKKAKERLHIVEGLLKALDNIEEVIKIIRGSKTIEDARTGLKTKLKLTLIQADSILEMRLRRLTALEKERVEDERKELKLRVSDLSKLLKSVPAQKKLLKSELEELVEMFGRPRRTKIVSPDDIESEELPIATSKKIVETPCELTLSTSGIVGWRPLQDDSERAKPSRNDVLAFAGHNTLTTATAWAFTSQGRSLSSPISSISQVEGSRRGTPTHQVFGTNAGEDVLYVMPDATIDETSTSNMKTTQTKENLVVITEAGTVKQLDTSKLSSFKSCSSYINLKANDKVIAVLPTPASKKAELILLTNNAQILRIKLSDFRPLSPQAAGIAGMKMKDGSKVIGAGIHLPHLPEAESAKIIAITNDSHIKMLPVEEFELKGRGGLGVRLCPLSGRQKIIQAYIGQTDNLLTIMANEDDASKVDSNPVKLTHIESKKTQKPEKTDRQILEVGINRWQKQ